MTWEIVTGLITLFSFIVAIVTPITKLTKVMTKLTASVENLRQVVDQMGTQNTESHKRIWEHNDEQDGRLNDHEQRIFKMEYDIKKYHEDPNYHGGRN